MSDYRGIPGGLMPTPAVWEPYRWVQITPPLLSCPSREAPPERPRTSDGEGAMQRRIGPDRD